MKREFYSSKMVSLPQTVQAGIRKTAISGQVLGYGRMLFGIFGNLREIMKMEILWALKFKKF